MQCQTHPHARDSQSLAALPPRGTTMMEASLRPPAAVDPVGEFINGTTIASDTASKSVKLPCPMKKFRSEKYSSMALRACSLDGLCRRGGVGIVLGHSAGVGDGAPVRFARRTSCHCTYVTRLPGHTRPWDQNRNGLLLAYR